MTCTPFCSECGGNLGHPANGDWVCQKCQEKFMLDKLLINELEKCIAPFADLSDDHPLPERQDMMPLTVGDIRKAIVALELQETPNANG